jgi:glyoxylase-like metal-dependent hydrolase (beta-lactamase superfamily II)
MYRKEMKYSKSCYGITGLSAETPWTVNSGFIIGGHTTLIVDTGSNYLSAKTIFGYARCVKPGNTLIVVNTEPHFDHIGGNCFFSEIGVDIFAHPHLQRTPEDFIQTKKDFNTTIQNPVRRSLQESEAFFIKTTLANPTKSLENRDNIDLGDVKAKIILTPGHTPFNISIFIDRESTLYCGDCIVSEYLPNLEVGSTEDWHIWLNSLQEIEKLNPEIIIPGHGDVIIGKHSIGISLKNMREILYKAIKESKAPTSC